MSDSVMNCRKRHFRIGAIDISLASSCRTFLSEYDSLYAPYRTNASPEDAVRVWIESQGRLPWKRGPFLIHSDAEEPFKVDRRFEVLPHLEWIINWQIIKQRADFVQLHASTLTSHRGALLMPGDPGAGKTTLTAGLLARGWDYLCDEFALIHPGTGAVHPFPRALCIKEPSFAVMDRLELPLSRRTPYRKPTKGRVAFLNPLAIRPDIVGGPSPVRWVVFPKYVAGAPPRLDPISRAQAAFQLMRQCFNLNTYRARALEILTDVVRGADCFHLRSGEIGATCDLVQTMVAGTFMAHRACA